VRSRYRSIGLALIVATALAAPSSALAGDFPVTTTDDSGPGSLREAIAGANSDPDASTIPISATGIIFLQSALPQITEPVAITGPGSDRLTVRRSSGGDYRIFTIDGASGDLTISGLTVENGKLGTASGDPPGGGGIWFQPVAKATLTLTDVVVRGNSAAAGGGIYLLDSVGGGSLTLNDSVVIGNTALTGGAAGIFAMGHLTLNNSVVTGNDAAASGGGIFLTNPLPMFETGPGSLAVHNSEVSDNTAGTAGGILTTGTAILTESVISGNGASGGSGGGGGGGILASGVLALDRSTVSGNTAAAGAGIYNTGNLTAVGSTLTENWAIGFGSLGIGGGLFNSSTAAIIDTTFAGNRADVLGGGILNRGAVGANGVTLAGNSAANGGGSVNGDGAIFTVANTLWAGNRAITGPDCVSDAGDPYASAGHNLISTIDPFVCGGFGPSDITNQNPLVGELGDNGGPTATVPLLPGSPAIDAGDPGTPGDPFPACPATDQRGLPRGGSAGPCDIGAFELQPAPPNPGGEQISPLTIPPPTTAPHTGRRAKALKRCKKAKKPDKRRKCKRRARRLPV
jgi:hypothetical protein